MKIKIFTFEKIYMYLNYDINEIQIYNKFLFKISFKKTFYLYSWQIIETTWLIIIEKFLLHDDFLTNEFNVEKIIITLFIIKNFIQFKK